MGALLCLLSAAAFGCMAIFGKLAYDEGVGVGDLLLVRFGLAALLLVLVAHATGVLRGVPRRALLAGLAMGAVGYSLQAGLYFLALERMDASLLSLLLYVYPALVMVAAVALRRERASGRRVVALAVASAGTALVLAGAGTGALDPLGTAMGLGAAITYAAYILVGDSVGSAMPPIALAALVTSGATVTFGLVALATGGPGFDFEPAGWGWLGALSIISTVGAILLFFAGLARVGPSAASILSTLEPAVTVGLAALAFGEALTAIQLAGATLVLGAVVVLGLPTRTGGGRQPGDSDRQTVAEPAREPVGASAPA